MTEQSKMPARVWAHPPASTVWCLISFTTPSADYNVAYIRADLVEPLVEALEHCQSALAMMIAPEAIKSTSVLHAFAQATEAECRARAAILRARQTEPPHDEF